MMKLNKDMLIDRPRIQFTKYYGKDIDLSILKN